MIFYFNWIYIEKYQLNQIFELWTLINIKLKLIDYYSLTYHFYFFLLNNLNKVIKQKNITNTNCMKIITMRRIFIAHKRYLLSTTGVILKWMLSHDNIDRLVEFRGHFAIRCIHWIVTLRFAPISRRRTLYRILVRHVTRWALILFSTRLPPLSETWNIPVGVVWERGRGEKGIKRGNKRSYRNTHNCPSTVLLRPTTSWQCLRMEERGRGQMHHRFYQPRTHERSVGGVNKDDEDEDVGKDNVGSRRLVAVVEATVVTVVVVVLAAVAGKTHLGVGVGRKEAATRLKKRRGMRGGIRRHVQTRWGASATTVRWRGDGRTAEGEGEQRAGEQEQER